MNYRHVLQAAMESPWAILPAKFQEIKAFLVSKAADTAPEAGFGAKAAPARPPMVQVERIAIVPLVGTIAPKSNMMTEFSGGTSAEVFAQTIRAAAADPNIDAIVIDVDSPGGSALGIPEAAAAVLDARSAKPVISVVTGIAASAGYWLAACASEMVMTDSGMVGSIGVFFAHQDLSQALAQEGVRMTLISAGKHKVDGNPYEPLSDAARADLQQKADAIHERFIADVAKGRGRQAEQVREGFGQGKVFMAKDALAAGMVDRVGTMRSTLSRLLRPAKGGGARTAIETEREFEAFLREEGGFSHARAKTIAAGGFKAGELPRDEGAESDMTGALEAIQGLAAKIRTT